MFDTNRTGELDDILQVLAVCYRRWILYLLMERELMTIDAVASELRTIDKAVTGETVAETRVTIRLHHADLPKLVDAGFIEYDHRNDDIILVNNSDELRNLLMTTKKLEDPAVQTELP
jgi:hypothetical protein